ncbi:MAG TPA: sulfurtransferase [Actinomycetales bacterium]|nr:sulfurtransferase [Actinomycetales bacterium]
MSALVQAADLRHEVSGPAAPLLVDVRWSLDGPDHDGYATGHLPGAVFCDLDAQLAAPPGEGGRHPLPSADQMSRTLQQLGIGAERDVVVYDGGNGSPAARAWWCLRWAGHERVRVLDGGLVAWVGAGGQLESGEVVAQPVGEATARVGAMPTVSADDVLAGHVGTLLDVRAPGRYRGESEPIDPVAGHIPGAVSLPISEMVADDGRLLPRDRLREVVVAALPAADLPPVVTAYCGSGITAAQMVLALHEAGLHAALYPGSWSEWIADPSRPVATGD